MLVHIKDIVTPAARQKYAVGAFNTFDLETTKAIIQAAENQKSPAIVQVSTSTLKYAGAQTIFSTIKTLAEQHDAPIAIHLDHCKDFATIKNVIDIGFSSVMIDGSDLSFDQNVSLTKQIVDYAHERDVWVQGEIGRLQGSEDEISVEKREAMMTDPDEAYNFVEQTGVDTLAVAVGTLHGPIKIYEVEAKIDIPRIEKIEQLALVPLVLHGASGLKPEQYQSAAYAGIDIANIDTDLRIVFTDTLRKTLKQDQEVIDPRKYFQPSIAAMQRVVEEKMQILGSSNQA